MIERPQAPPESRAGTPSPGVNIQDVEHDVRPETRVDNAGIKVKPRAKKPDEPEPQPDPEKEHEKAPRAGSNADAEIAH